LKSLGKALRRVSWGEGVKDGLSTTWVLGRIIFPVTVAVYVLRYTAVYDFLLSGVAPAMGLFGLPGEAAVPLVLGNLIGLYAGIGAILTMELAVKQVFILAVMLSFSHMLPVESAICRKVGVSLFLVVAFRLGLAVAGGLAVHHLWSGGQETARYGLVAPQETEPAGWAAITFNAVEIAALGVLQIALIVFPLMVFIRAMRDLGALEWFAGLMRPLMRPLGMAPQGAVTMTGGMLFGLAFGAGIILQQAREQEFTRREITLIVLFLCACHAVVEDTLIFIPLGIDVLPLLLIRLATAIVLTVLIARLWKEPEKEPAGDPAAPRIKPPG
jgi:spore maturation protein SpmB